MVRGARLLLALEGEPPRLYGFYAARVVKARDEDEARSIASKLVESEMASLPMLDAGATCTVDTVESIGFFTRISANAGFTFFPEEPE